MQIKNKLIIIGIALVFALFIGYGIEVFDPTPKHDDFCQNALYNYNNEDECLANGGEWRTDHFGPKSEGVYASCQPLKECYNQFDNASKKQGKTIFIVSLVISIITIIVSFIIKKEEVASGLLGGSILLILYGTIRYWEYAQNVIKFGLLGVALAVLIWIGYKKLK